MSVTNIALAVAAASGMALGAAVLHSVRGLRKDVAELRSRLADTLTHDAAAPDVRVPSARTATEDEIRTAVAQALADERERELAEARAFWAEQEAREASDGSIFDGTAFGGALSGDALFGDATPYLPRQADLAGLEPLFSEAAEAYAEVEGDAAGDLSDAAPGESAELAAARRRHPSHPDFKPHGGSAGEPAIADHERTVARLEDLSALRTPLVDVRPGPLGTLDVYVFADGTTLCLSPGHRDTADRLSAALVGGMEPILLGGSAVSGAFALTFECAEESVYVLADRVIASL
ncbi:hypothetical protein [Streptomyces boninensis]|uniref:hypothetical protein n=1 Tax=Streptomyces boninensis TaxID=2039455 RepID=UPI003B227663